MSSAASRPPEFPESTNKSAKQPTQASPEPPAQPKLMGPPKRPSKPLVPEPPVETPPQVAESPAVVATQEPVQPPAVIDSGMTPSATVAPAMADESEMVKPRQQPISPPSEPMQYRAIGLLRGRYVPSEEMFNRGQIITQDDTAVGAVLLGRVTSLVKKHLDMENAHLWVVYPRTNPEQGNALNVQIVGVWEPETLGTGDSEMADDEVSADAAADSSDTAESAPSKTAEVAESSSKPAPAQDMNLPTSDEIEADYFSIRGEIAKYFEEKGEIMINIMQKVKSGAKQQRPFRLVIDGHLEGKTIGYFWDLHVERRGDKLVLTEGTQIAAVPPKKKSKRRGPGGGGGGPRKRFAPKGGPQRRVVGGSQGGSGNYRSSRPTREATSETARADKA